MMAEAFAGAQGLKKLSAECNLNFCNDLKAVTHNRKFFGHHDGPGKGGTQKTMLLPSGIVLNCEAPPAVVRMRRPSEATPWGRSTRASG